MSAIPDCELMKIPIIDCGERLVDLGKISKTIVIQIEPISKKCQGLTGRECFVRERVAKMLVRAQRYLPRYYRLKIVDGFRPLAAQRIWYDQVRDEIRAAHPFLSETELKTETDKWVAPIELVPFHSTGGAVDLTIVNERNAELDMGWPINTIGENAATEAPVNFGARANRALLRGVMQRAGFVNYPLEWWHWSFGDRYWAAVRQTYSIYGGRENLER